MDSPVRQRPPLIKQQHTQCTFCLCLKLKRPWFKVHSVVTGGRWWKEEGVAEGSMLNERSMWRFRSKRAITETSCSSSQTPPKKTGNKSVWAWGDTVTGNGLSLSKLSVVKEVAFRGRVEGTSLRPSSPAESPLHQKLQSKRCVTKRVWLCVLVMCSLLRVYLKLEVLVAIHAQFWGYTDHVDNVWTSGQGPPSGL